VARSEPIWVHPDASTARPSTVPASAPVAPSKISIRKTSVPAPASPVLTIARFVRVWAFCWIP